MKRVKGYIAIGIVLLVIGFVLTIVWFAQIANMFRTDTDIDALANSLFWVYVLAFFQVIVYSGGLFLVIFFSIRGHKIDKREQLK